MRSFVLSVIALVLTPPIASAELLSFTSPSIRSDLCVGGGCLDTQSFPAARDFVLLRSADSGIRFEDTSTNAGFPSNDWQISANQTDLNSENAFFIEDLDAGTQPFWIQAGAPTNSLFMGSDGFVGIGTALPQRVLHVTKPFDPTIRLEQSGVQSIPPYFWEMYGNENDFSLVDNNSSIPLRIDTGAPNDSLKIKGPGTFSGLETAGWVGLGTNAPEGKLHTKGDGVQLTYFESGDGGPVQVRFRTDSENRRFLAVNNANEVKSQIIFLDDRINFTGETDSGANLWLSIGPDGIVSQGPTCNPGPCDATFDPEQFEVPPLKERTAYMWENQHLWAVGPTKPGEPINLTEKTGAMLHELEVAYIYIERLHDRLEAQDELNAQLLSRLEALEAK